MEEFIKTILDWIFENPIEAFIAKVIGDSLPRFGFHEFFQLIKVSYHWFKLIFSFSIIFFVLIITAIPYRLKKQSFSKDILDYIQMEFLFLDIERTFKSYYEEKIQGKLKLNW